MQTLRNFLVGGPSTNISRQRKALEHYVNNEYAPIIDVGISDDIRADVEKNEYTKFNSQFNTLVNNSVAIFVKGKYEISTNTDTGEEEVNYEFSVYNGSKGSTGDKGEQGDKGVKGDTGIAIYNTDVNDLIYNSLEAGELSSDELSQLILSAAQGVILGNKLEELEEVYLNSQAEYDALLADGKIKDNVKYMIFEEGE